MRVRPRLVAWLISTAIRFRFNSGVRVCLPPAWVKQSSNPMRPSSSISSDTIGAKGSMSVSSALSATASAGMSSAVSGEITSSPASSRRTGPSPVARTCSSSASAPASSSVTAASATAGSARLAHEPAERCPVGRPRLGGEQVGGRVGVAPRARHPDVAGAQPVAEREQGAQLPEVPVGAGIARCSGHVEVAAPACRYEPRRGVGRDPAGAGGVQCAQDPHRREQLGRRGAAGELHRGQDLRGELPQVPVGRHVERAEVAVIARQAGYRLRQRRPDPWPPDPLAPDQAADVLVGDGRVGDHHQEVIEQGLAVLSGLAALGQRVAHRAFGLALPRRHRLVEQAHHLVEDIDGRLGQHRQQDRVAALRIATLEGLRGQPAPDRGQEPAPLRRQHRQIQRVGAQPAQELQLRDLGLDPRRGGLDRPSGQPPQPGHPDLGVHHQQPVQPGAPLRR